MSSRGLQRVYPIGDGHSDVDENSCKVKFGSCELVNRLLSWSKRRDVFSDFGLLAGDVYNGLIIDLAIIGRGNIYKILRPLKVLVIGHVGLP